MNLDALVSAGQPPWQPSADARDIDVWEKPDFPVSGTYRLGETLVIFVLVTTAGSRSLWAYVPVPPEREDIVASSRFGSDAELDAFVEECFAGREAVFAVAHDFVIQSKSDGTRIGTGPNALLAAAAEWYIMRVTALMNMPALRVATTNTHDLLVTTQGVLAVAPT